MEKHAKIYVAGHNGLVGSAIWKNLSQKGYTNLIGKSSSELDLRNTQSVAEFFAKEQPEYVFLACARIALLPSIIFVDRVVRFPVPSYLPRPEEPQQSCHRLACY